MSRIVTYDTDGLSRKIYLELFCHSTSIKLHGILIVPLRTVTIRCPNAKSSYTIAIQPSAAMLSDKVRIVHK